MSVYAPSDYNHHWYKLQKEFIERNTTVSYDFKVIVNNIDTSLFEEEEIVKVNNENIGHPAGIRQIFDYMRENQQYSGYLLLDSDCFPVRIGWQDIITKQMAQFKKNLAAPIRFENLDFFPHPCVVYMNKNGVNNPEVNFDYSVVKNLLGDDIDEVGGNMVNVMDDVMPLLRTNRINLHPVAAGIYHHLFYHHGAGSRGFDFRLLKMYGYYDHWIDNNEQPNFGENLISLLRQSPESFVEKLMYGY